MTQTYRALGCLCVQDSEEAARALVDVLRPRETDGSEEEVAEAHTEDFWIRRNWQ